MLVEVGFILDKPLEYYEKLLNNNGLENTWNNEIHDTYYTKETKIILVQVDKSAKKTAGSAAVFMFMFLRFRCLSRLSQLPWILPERPVCQTVPE